MRGLKVILLTLVALPAVFAVKSHDFKTCSQAAFCRRGRALATRARESSSWTSPYSVDPASVTIDPTKATFTAGVRSSIYPEIKFGLDVRVHEDGVVRVRMDEVDGLRKRYDEASSWALIADPEISREIQWTVAKDAVRAVYGHNNNIEVVVAYEPLKVSLLRNGQEQIVLNGDGLLHMEHFRTKEAVDQEKSGWALPEAPEEGLDLEDAQVVMQMNPRSWFEGVGDDGWWEETFGTWTDSKPKGPESLSIDINFPNHGHVYGIPQHATRLSLPTTAGEDAYYSDPYRLYNADVFEYLADSTMSLYGSIPVMHAHSAESTVAIFNAVGSETWIDVAHFVPKSTHTHWISESGIMDIFLMPGPTPADVFAQYARLTGTSALPAQWALGYHQCRWNYISSDDVRDVQTRFDEEDIPVDVFWLDIEYAEDHKYFIWDKKSFPDPVDMLHDVEAIQRKMVVIVDPHLKRTDNYPIYQQAKDLDLLIKKKDGQEYEGWCWPGSSAWVDFFNPASWDWWKSLFKTMPEGDKWAWIDSTENTYIWNDMNEPSIFNGPEISMPRDNIHYGGWEHRDVHNINGMLFHNMTAQAVMHRTDPPKRPFVLTRSFYAGSQRLGAMWTGDNLGTWEHMAVGVSMVLSLNVGGFSFSGSDVGGFFGNPEPDMLVRWYGVGAFSPFFRAHAHIDTKRREPYLLEEPYKSIVRDILRLRYSLLPVWYTAFREASVNGLPVVRPHYVVFPQDEGGFDLDDQYFVGGSGLLVKPITRKDVTETTMYLPENEVYYDYFTGHAYRGAATGKNVTVPAELHQIPLLIRGGSIVPTRERPRRASPLMKHDPFTLRVALSTTGTARGELYLDEGETFAHQAGQFVWRAFEATAEKGGKEIRIRSRDLAARNLDTAVDGVALTTYDARNAFAKDVARVRVERIVVLGLSREPRSVVADGKEVHWEYKAGAAAASKGEGTASMLLVKDPHASITTDWEITIHL
ncbi:glycoside hydrolase family 31 protein [Gelatoporia subvermispora B]|uniref:Glucosidase II subunit alpha n=1 Tax=Ceriporiopsis subvermispora (strain B) TaxID=914234 RepID=M2Q417_CERS8|nr:glycoside hydrolase family 31 protein [Gelatoporia subvermispora B]